MADLIDSMAERLWKVLNKVADTNLWPFVIGLIILAFGLSFLIQYKRMKHASQQFATGVYNEKTIRLCERYKRRSIFPQSAELHDLLCCMLSAMYLENGEVALYFENINAIKNVTDDISWRVYLLLAAYLTGNRYHDIAVAHRVKKEYRNTEEIIVQMLQACDKDTIHDKAKTATENITKQQILEILHILFSRGSQ